MAADRLSNAIDNLVGHLVPNNPRESQDVSQQRHDKCIRMTKTILERFVENHCYSDIYFFSVSLTVC